MKLLGILMMGLLLVFAFTGLQNVRANETDEAYGTGLKYYKGDVVKKDYAEAVKWYRKAAHQGHQAADDYVEALLPLEKVKEAIWPSSKGIPSPEYEIKYNDRTVTIARTSTTFLVNKSYIREAYHDFVKFGTLAFGVDGVENFSLQYKLKMTDFYGNESFNDAIIISMPKEDFLKFNWKALDQKPIDRQLELTCSKYYIHPSLLRGVKKEDLWLTY